MNSVRDQVRSRTMSQVWDHLFNSVCYGGRSSIYWKAVRFIREPMELSVYNQVFGSVGNRVYEFINDEEVK